jgi:hypothetical protein
MSSKKLPLGSLLAVAIAALCLTAAPAIAAKGGGGGAKGNANTSGGGGSLSLVPLDSTDGLPHWGQQIRFDYQTTATAEPRVDVKCFQSGTLVYSAFTGYYDSYPWPSSQTFTLSSRMWTGGDADCSAVLYSLANSGAKTTLATLSFRAYA